MEKQIKVYWLVLIFAGSITSIVLGLVAIFYSIITNQQSTENFGRLKDAVTKIEKGAQVISSVSENINTKLDRISDDIVKFGTKENAEQESPKSNLTSENSVVSDPTANLPDDKTSSASEEKEVTNG